MTTTPNPNSWNKVATVIYVDSPIGTGFSYCNADGYSKTEDDIANNLYTFLTMFFVKYSTYASLPFYIFGESYSAKTVPNLAYLIHSKNLITPNIPIKLTGIAMANGFLDPAKSYGAFGGYAYANGMINREVYKQAKVASELCQLAVDCGDFNASTSYCNQVLDTFIFINQVVQDKLSTEFFKPETVVGTQKWIKFLNWRNIKTFERTTKKPFMINPDKVGGHYQTYGGLTLLSIAGAGHFSAMDQPATALQVVTSFINNQLN
eukprot:gene15591-18522_t